MTEAQKLIEASKRADWKQVELNGGPPCFHLEADNRFCFRARRWVGHIDGQGGHEFVPLHTLVEELVTP